MKKHLTKPYPELPAGWTVARQRTDSGLDKLYAYNVITGVKGPLRWHYEDALKDIQSPNAEPWGV